MTNENSGRPKVIFFGNGPLSDAALTVFKNHFDIIFHAKTKEDLETVKKIMQENSLKDAETAPIFGILASYGVIIKSDVLDLFEPTGILNIHPSLLPKYRGPSPIETAILSGDTTFGVSIMKLAAAMDAGPIYYQTTKTFDENTEKQEIYRILAETGANWLVENLQNLPEPIPQDDSAATFTKMLDKSLSPLDPTKKSAEELQNQIRAYTGYPKSKYEFFGLDCTIIKAHVATPEEATNCTNNVHTMYIQCHDKSILIIDEIQPAGRKVMDAKSFLNGYCKK